MIRKKRAFLAAYCECGTIKRAAIYANGFAAARIEAADRLGAEARRRAIEDVPEPVFTAAS